MTRIIPSRAVPPSLPRRYSVDIVHKNVRYHGCSPDNTTCAGLFGGLKGEFFFDRDRSDITADRFMEVLPAYIA